MQSLGRWYARYFNFSYKRTLTGDLTGLYAVTVNGNWRMTFAFNNGDAELVDYLDYH